MLFNYKITNNKNIKIVHFLGELIDREQPAPLLAELIVEIEKGNNKIVLDFEQLKYINSSGLSIIINILTKARKAGGDVAICSVNKKISELLVITKLDSIFNVCKNAESGVKLLKS